MLKIALSGCNGRMGHVISDIVAGRDGMEIVAGFDINTAKYADFPVFADPFEFNGICDVIIDFSNASSTEHLLSYCEKPVSYTHLSVSAGWFYVSANQP